MKVDPMFRKLNLFAFCLLMILQGALAQNPDIVRYINTYKFIAIKEM